MAAGLDLEKWDSGGYSAKFMARVIAWNRNVGLMKSHQESAKAEAAERKAKKGK